jgi:hypothetical protein
MYQIALKVTVLIGQVIEEQEMGELAEAHKTRRGVVHGCLGSREDGLLGENNRVSAQSKSAVANAQALKRVRKQRRSRSAQ